MKKLFTFIVLILLFSCSKQTESNTITGKWRPIEMMDDVGGEKINNPDSYIQFYSNGTFKIHSNGVRNYSFPYLQKFDHYLIRPNDFITFYNSLGDSTSAWYGFHNGLYLSYGYVCDVYIRTP